MIAPTTSPGMTQETRNRPRMVAAPGKRSEKNSARPKPRTNCPPIEPTTKNSVLRATSQNSGCATTEA